MTLYDRFAFWLLDLSERFLAWVDDAMDVDLDEYECLPGWCNLPPGHNGDHDHVELP